MGLSQDCLDQVLKLKPDINRQDSTGFTALHWAVCVGFNLCASFLMLRLLMDLTYIDRLHIGPWLKVC